MATERTTKGRIGRLQRLLGRLNGNREELQHVEPSRARLEEVFSQILQMADLQASHTAAKQEASQKLQALLTEADRLATILQLAVKHHYGIRSEKLVDFGLKVFRGRPRKPAVTETPTAPPPETKPPAAPQTSTP